MMMCDTEKAHTHTEGGRDHDVHGIGEGSGGNNDHAYGWCDHADDDGGGDNDDVRGDGCASAVVFSCM